MEHQQKFEKIQGITAAYTLKYGQQDRQSSKSQSEESDLSDLIKHDYRIIRQKRLTLGNSQLIIKYDNGVKQQWMDNQMVANLRQNIQFKIIYERIFVTEMSVYSQDIKNVSEQSENTRQIYSQSFENKKVQQGKAFINRPKIDEKKAQKLQQYQVNKYQLIIARFNLKSLYQMIVSAINEYEVGENYRFQIQQNVNMQNKYYPQMKPQLLRQQTDNQHNEVIYTLKFKFPLFQLYQIKLLCVDFIFQDKHLPLLFLISQNQPVSDQILGIKTKQQRQYRVPGSFTCKITSQGFQRFIYIQKIQNARYRNDLKLQQLVFLSEIPISQYIDFINSKKVYEKQLMLRFYQFKIHKISGSLLCGIVSNAERANQYKSSAKSIHSIYYGLRTGNKSCGGMQQPCGRPVKQGAWVKVLVDPMQYKVKWYTKKQIKDEYQLIGESNIPKRWIRKNRKIYFNLQMSRIGDKIMMKL